MKKEEHKRIKELEEIAKTRFLKNCYFDAILTWLTKKERKEYEQLINKR